MSHTTPARAERGWHLQLRGPLAPPGSGTMALAPLQVAWVFFTSGLAPLSQSGGLPS